MEKFKMLNRLAVAIKNVIRAFDIFGALASKNFDDIIKEAERNHNTMWILKKGSPKKRMKAKS